MDQLRYCFSTSLLRINVYIVPYPVFNFKVHYLRLNTCLRIEVHRITHLILYKKCGFYDGILPGLVS